ncbi:hypothetical protein [Micromonospora parathelypteridis]|uniref:Uncharacterized protein n=1 Tax=Micromonospora parathelypteridis TaxID=1839617 RepID=A0A840W0K9_9ACTN|nr:hypothetical protein [Micromonospora parathelypteridis]MBB5476761.1 hypothetical protein [Micromonospora parathelypteridis]GGO16851.1 hypothetical protein GCM10011576_30190 [Micromonospora parathelypteridis]
MDIERWAWAGQERFPGFCFTFVQDRDPGTVAAAVGADSLTVLTLIEAEEAHPISKPGALLRFGTYGQGVFCFEDRAPIANREPAITRLAQGTRLLQVTKSGDGMVVVREVVDGRKVQLFEPGEAVYVDGPLRPRVAALLPEHSRIVAALAVVADEVGADLDRATLDGPLATALSMLNERASR